MANNYLQFSVRIGDLTLEEVNFWIGVQARGECGYSIYIDAENVRCHYALLYAEEFGDAEALADDIQAFLERFRPTKRIEVEWAETCSSMRPGEFGGGSILVTSYQQYWMSTQSALEILNRDADAQEAA